MKVSEIPLEKGEQIPAKRLYQGENLPNNFARENVRSNRFDSGPSDRVRVPFIMPSQNLKATYTIMALNVVFFILSLITELQPYLYFNIIYLLQQFTIWTVLTSLFIPGDIISMIFSELIIFSMGRTIEPRFGSKFFSTLYLVSGFFTVIAMGLLQLLGLLIPSIGFLSLGLLSANGGIFLGLIAFFAFLAGMDTRLQFFFFFIPVNLKAKYILYFLVGMDLIFGIVYFFAGEPSCVASLGSLAGLLAAKLLHNLVRGRITQRWY
jgi:membrane associated rhomboid family serine protease